MNFSSLFRWWKGFFFFNCYSFAGYHSLVWQSWSFQTRSFNLQFSIFLPCSICLVFSLWFTSDVSLLIFSSWNSVCFLHLYECLFLVWKSFLLCSCWNSGLCHVLGSFSLSMPVIHKFGLLMVFLSCAFQVFF